MRSYANLRKTIHVKIVALLARAGFKEEYFLTLLALLIGGATGVGAYGFFAAMEWVKGISYGDGGGLFAGHWYMLILLPAAGALVVGIITQSFAREAKGHGVPEVMDAIYRQGGIVRPRVALAKAVASAFTLGTGGSAGTEGPIIQIGAAIGSAFGQFFRVHPRQLSTLVACGAAGGIASIFNAPIAGVLFALEIFLKDFSFKAFAPVVFASVISCSLTHALSANGDVALFGVQQSAHYVFNGSELPFFLVLGLICALVAIAFIRLLYGMEDLADAVKLPEFVKPIIGAVALGGIGVVYFFGGSDGNMEVPSFFGNGYPLIQAVIDSTGVVHLSALSLLLLCAFKLVATCCTLGSGGSGGIFAPSLFMGATVGGAFGLTLHSMGWIDETSIAAYALVGMSAVIAATTHAPLTAIVILYEITREPHVILPVMFAAIVATTGAQKLCRDSIYTLKLRRRGVRMGTLADLTILKRITADQVPHSPAVRVRYDDPLQKVIDLAARNGATDFIVVDANDRYQGVVMADDIQTALLQPEAVPLLLVAELTRNNVPVVKPTETLDNVLDAFAHADVDSLPVATADGNAPTNAVVTLQAVMARYQRELDRPSV